MSRAATAAVLQELCKELKMPTVLKDYQAIAHYRSEALLDSRNWATKQE